MAKATPILFFLLLAAAVSAFGQADYLKYYDDDRLPPIRELYDAGRYDIVEQACDYAFRRGQPSVEWRTLRMKALWRQGKYEMALEQAAEVPVSYKNELPALMEVHDFYRSMGKDEEAAGVLEVVNETALKLKPNDRKPPQLVALGKAAHSLGADPATVLEQYFDLAKIDRAKEKRKPNEAHPGLVEAHIATAELALEKSDYKRTADEYRAALKFRPNDPDLVYGMAKAFFPGDRKKAVEFLEKALDLNPMHVPSILLMAEYLIDSEQYEAAFELVVRALSVNQLDPMAWAYQSTIFNLAKNDLEAAEEAREKALEVWDKDPEVDHTIGRVLSRNYRFAEGAASQRRALEMDPDFLPAKLQLAHDLLRLGKEDEAFALAKEVSESDPYEILAYNLSILEQQIAKFETVESDHFTVRMPANEMKIYGDRVVDLLEESYDVLSKKYGLKLEDRVLVEFFPEQQDFAIRTFGNLGGAGILGACFGSVVTMNSPGGLAHGKNNWEATLWHEFAHVVTLTLTKNKMPRWLSEGISVYEEMQRDPTWGQRMTPRYRTMILEDGDLTPISELSSAFLNPKSGEHIMFAYYESYLVVEYLVEKYGMDSFRNILTDLADGVLINDAIAKHTTEMSELEEAFADYVEELAENLAPGVDWNQPEPDEVNPRNALAVAAYLKKNPKNFWARQTHTSNLLGQKQWDQAVKSADELIKLFPDYVDGGNGYFFKAAAYRALEQPEQEADVLRQLAEKSSEAHTAYTRLMDLDLAGENWKELLANANRAAALNPFMKQIHYCRGCALEATGQVGEAVTSFEKLLRLRPTNPSEVRFRLAKLLKPEDESRSRRYLLDALSESPRYREAHDLLLEFEPAPEPEGKDGKGILKKVMGQEKNPPASPAAEDPFGAPAPGAIPPAGKAEKGDE
ncbi:MAG: hypothetical protein HKN23_17515 [Verrucomicrobiales bacterium]|nr:hypothetical protein [Verrucomicrobiales bacterium]